MGYADLHIHTTYSDSSNTPEEAVKQAVRNHVTLMAVSDHNVIGGSLAARPLAEKAGIRLIPAVEIDALFENTDIHILAYNVDFENKALISLLVKARRALDKMSEDLLIAMKGDYPQLDMAEYLSFPYDYEQGGWAMLQYLLKKGITGTLWEGASFYPQYDVTYAKAGFAPAEEVIGTIHHAGGLAILAHPGAVFKNKTIEEFMACVGRAVSLGLDGIECYYPTHTGLQTQSLLDYARSKKLRITSGGDCHGHFGKTEIGQLKTDESLIIL